MNNASVSSGTKKKILIADDDPAILEALSLMLEETGYIVKTTVDGKTAQDMKDELPNLLLLDVWMAGMDGRDICKHLKKQQKTKDIPIILISANRDVEGMAKECGADGFIAKPFEMKDFLSKIKKYLH